MGDLFGLQSLLFGDAEGWKVCLGAQSAQFSVSFSWFGISLSSFVAIGVVESLVVSSFGVTFGAIGVVESLVVSSFGVKFAVSSFLGITAGSSSSMVSNTGAGRRIRHQSASCPITTFRPSCLHREHECRRGTYAVMAMPFHSFSFCICVLDHVFNASSSCSLCTTTMAVA